MPSDILVNTGDLGDPGHDDPDDRDNHLIRYAVDETTGSITGSSETKLDHVYGDIALSPDGSKLYGVEFQSTSSTGQTAQDIFVIDQATDAGTDLSTGTYLSRVIGRNVCMDLGVRAGHVSQIGVEHAL